METYMKQLQKLRGTDNEYVLYIHVFAGPQFGPQFGAQFGPQLGLLFGAGRCKLSGGLAKHLR